MSNMIRIPFLLIFCLVLQTAKAQQPGAGMTRLPVGTRAPDFILRDMDGNRFSLADYRGKPVIINFWASWCPPCREEMPSMQRAWEKLQHEDILLLAINVGEDEETIFQFTANYPVDFPLLMDQDSAVTGEWPVKGLPTTYVVDPKGDLVYRAIGGREWDDDDLLDQVRALRTR